MCPCRTVIFRCFSPTTRASITSRRVTANVGSGLPAPNGCRRTDFLDQLQIHFVQTHFGIDVQRRNLGACPGPIRHHFVNRSRNSSNPGLWNRHTCCTGMPTKSLQHLPTGSQPLIEIEPASRPCRAFRRSLLIDGHDNRRAVKPFDQARRHDTHHPEMPLPGGQDKCGGISSDPSTRPAPPP